MNSYKDDLKSSLSGYTEKEKAKILKAYEFAADAHFGQFRCSGEAYISHPVAVAKILISMSADADTVCAGLLHDTIEDTEVTFSDIAYAFGTDVAILVDGVTKMGDFRFSTKKERDLANTRKIITSITTDIRIIIIKLADRLHNMSTMDSKSFESQQAKSFETLHIFAPVANSIGAYQIKNKLEDLSLKYLEPESYKSLLNQRNEFYEKYRSLLTEVTNEIAYILNNNGISGEIKQRIKSVYSIYKKKLPPYIVT